jgi:GTP-binding protein
VRVIGAEFETTAAGPEGFPSEGLPEVAFLGRSNVGKSSLLNKLVARKGLARTSGTPGKTRLLHFFRVRRRDASETRELLLVDLPGYGFARVSQAERKRWEGLVEGYLEGRAPLRAAVLLQDLRRDVSDDELDLLAWLAERGIPVLVALTKCDKLKPMRRKARVEAQRAAFGLGAGRVVATSASSGLGIAALWAALDPLLAEASEGA